LLAHGADTLVLGCTHYPFLAPLIREIVGPDIVLVDTGEAVARQLLRRLQELPTAQDAPAHFEVATRFYTSGDARHAAPIIAMLQGEPVTVQPLPHEFA
jgi:glutamate racemase